MANQPKHLELWQPEHSDPHPIIPLYDKNRKRIRWQWTEDGWKDHDLAAENTVGKL